ncbi:AAA family ATPase [Paenibacillus sp. J2TS4]|uniref:AAA family ATPase n=1 Tax=Paenibacillus sp. J2TS4 TaxID=2807194 RepID=UPI001B21DBAF|nr:AAA family ATPase [Paenibacillus sp. J2TS4]GIP35369.1 putative ATPase YjoB [Paenibacillus sp. J2TS4]
MNRKDHIIIADTLPHRQEPSLVAFSADNSRASSYYTDYAYVIQGIEQWLADRYGWEVRSYISDDGNEEYWALLEQDIRSNHPEAERVAQIYEQVEAKAFAYHSDGPEAGYQIFPSVRNNVFAYPEWRVAVARVPMFGNHGMYTEDFIFAESDLDLRRFLDYTRQRRRELDRRQVTVFTDGRHGIETGLEPITRLVDREEVVMNPEWKKQIFRSIDQFFSEDRGFFQTFEIPYKRGILLYGKPGNGKTTLVKSIAGSVQAPVAYWQITEHTCSDSIQEVFQAAAVMAPMILIIEDIDSMPEQVRSFFLNTLDGATSKEGIFLIGTTNYPERIDPALMNRAGRFDRAYEIKPPNTELRQAYLKRKGMQKLLGEEGLQEAARLAEGFSFAQLNELYVSAALEWYYEKKVDIGELIGNMKSELHKGRTQGWLRDAEAKVGFHT